MLFYKRHIAFTLLFSSIHLSHCNTDNFESKLPRCEVPGMVGTCPVKACIIIKRLLAENKQYPFGAFPSDNYRHKNVLLFEGPTGIGKTMLAQAIATNTDSHFVMIKCPNVLNRYIGGTKDIINESIEIAIAEGKALKKRVFILFDEIDKIASTDKSTAHNEYEAGISALWCYLDKYIRDPHVFFIFTTNHLNRLPPEFKNRIGNNIISMEKPDIAQRNALLHHLSKLITQKELPEYCSHTCIETLTEETEKFSVRNLEDIFTSAQEDAFYQNVPLTQEHIMYALNETKRSLEKENEPTEEEREKQRTRKREDEQDEMQRKTIELQEKNASLQKESIELQRKSLNVQHESYNLQKDDNWMNKQRYWNS